MATKPVKAHQQTTTIRLMESVPEHDPRSTDPHYKLFVAAKRRMKKLGLLVCAIDGCRYPGPIEMHHARIEYSLQGGVDLEKFNRYYGLHLKDDEAFKEYIEGEGNLEPLCPTHHRTKLGVHELPEPFWQAIRVWKADLPPPAQVMSNVAAVSATVTRDRDGQKKPLNRRVTLRAIEKRRRKRNKRKQRAQR